MKKVIDDELMKSCRDMLERMNTASEMFAGDERMAEYAVMNAFDYETALMFVLDMQTLGMDTKLLKYMRDSGSEQKRKSMYDKLDKKYGMDNVGEMLAMYEVFVEYLDLFGTATIDAGFAE